MYVLTIHNGDSVEYITTLNADTIRLWIDSACAMGACFDFYYFNDPEA